MSVAKGPISSETRNHRKPLRCLDCAMPALISASVPQPANHSPLNSIDMAASFSWHASDEAAGKSLRLQHGAVAFFLLLENVDDRRHAVLPPGRRVGARPLEGDLLPVGRAAREHAADPLLFLDLLQLLADLPLGIDGPVAEQVELDRGVIREAQALALLLGPVREDLRPVRADEMTQIRLDGIQLTRLVL